MMVPPGVSITKPYQVCKFVKFLYGFKQTSRQWYERLTKFLHEHQYKQASSYHSLFVKANSPSLTIS